MRDIADLTAGECANRASIERAVRRLERDAERLPVNSQGQKAMRLVDEIVAQTRDTLASCP